jgi:hypothetical protein
VQSFAQTSRAEPMAYTAPTGWTLTLNDFMDSDMEIRTYTATLETVAQRQPVEHTGVASINPRTAEPEKRDRPNGL